MNPSHLHVLNDYQKIEICEKYKTGNYNCCELGKEYKVTSGNISKILKRRNIKINNDPSELRREYILDETYFEKIDTEGKAYFLGLLYADGSVNKEKNDIVLSLQEKDSYILEKFKTELSSTRPLVFIDKQSKNKNWQNSIKFIVSSKKMKLDLIRLGCHPNKTFTLQFPTEEQVPSHLLRHFIRGYFDGDGCLYIGKNNECEFSIVSTLDFCNELAIKFKEIFDIKSCISTRFPERNNCTRTLKVHKRSSILQLKKWFYEDASVYLNRKLEKFNFVQSIYKEYIDWTNMFVCIDGIKEKLPYWCNLYQIDIGTVKSRVIRNTMNLEQAIKTPLLK